MGKHTFTVDYTGKYTFNLGEKNLYIRTDSKLDSISVDCGIGTTSICLSGNFNRGMKATIFDVKDYSIKDLAELIFDLIRIKRPERLYIDEFGLGVAITDYLVSFLATIGIVLGKSGVLVYEVMK